MIAAGLGTLAAPAISDAAPQRARHQLTIPSLPAPVPQLDPTQLSELLQAVAANPAALPAVVAQVTPSQVLTLAPAAVGQVLDGLGTIATSLASSQPTPAQVDVVIDQLSAVLAGGVPTDPTQLGDLQTVIDLLPTLVATPGVDPTKLEDLQATIVKVVGGVAGVPGSNGTNGTNGTGLPGSVTLLDLLDLKPRPATTQTSGGASPAGASGGAEVTGTRFRARVSRVRVARDNRVVRARLTCPSFAPACVVAVTLKAPGLKAKPRFYGLRADTTKRIRLRVPYAVAKRLAARGGKVKVTATTVGSSLAPIAKRARAHRG